MRVSGGPKSIRPDPVDSNGALACVKSQRQPDHRLDRSQFLRVVRPALIALVEAFSLCAVKRAPRKAETERRLNALLRRAGFCFTEPGE
jgi:hypothetical protein